MRNVKKSKIIFLMLVILAGTMLISETLGRLGVPFNEIPRILISRLVPVERTWTDSMETAVINIRLPRIILCVLVGSGLSAAGTAYQGIFRNPMASPDLLGATSGACFGAALSIILGLSGWMVTLFAFISGVLTIVVVSFVSGSIRGNRAISLILSGMVISSLFSAGTSYIKLVADPLDQLPAITYWMMGSLSGVSLDELIFCLIPVAAGTVALIALRWRLNLLTLGDDEAETMGVDTRMTRNFVIAFATLITAACVSVSGMIGWVGLVVPHMARRLIGNDFRYLMPCASVMGGIFLLLVDDVARTIALTEIPIGILTAFIGAPFFIYLMTSGREKI